MIEADQINTLMALVVQVFDHESVDCLDCSDLMVMLDGKVNTLGLCSYSGKPTCHRNELTVVEI